MRKIKQWLSDLNDWRLKRQTHGYHHHSVIADAYIEDLIKNDYKFQIDQYNIYFVVDDENMFAIWNANKMYAFAFKGQKLKKNEDGMFEVCRTVWNDEVPSKYWCKKLLDHVTGKDD